MCTAVYLNGKRYKQNTALTCVLMGVLVVVGRLEVVILCVCAAARKCTVLTGMYSRDLEIGRKSLHFIVESSTDFCPT